MTPRWDKMPPSSRGARTSGISTVRTTGVCRVSMSGMSPVALAAMVSSVTS